MEDFSKYNAEGTQLRKLQIRILSILISVDKICRQHGIPYWLDFGTLLGAVRHQGFIPWDDDVDISVLESDYDRLREILIKELPSHMAFQDSTTDYNVFYPYGRVRDKKSYCYYPKFVKQKEQGCWIDIFKYSRITSARAKNVVDFFYRRAYREIHNYGDVSYKSRIIRFIKKTSAYILYPFTLLGVKLIRYCADKKNSNLYGRYATTQHTYDINQIFPLCEIEFEGYRFLAPHNYDAHLKRIYGDYMQIPPEDKREQILDLSKIKFYDE